MDGSRRRTLLLTGAAEGLGASIAETFARAGHDVIGLSRTERASGHLKRLVEQGGGSYTHLACDIARPPQLIAAIERYADRIDVLVHNAHVLTIRPFVETAAGEFEQAWRVACLGAMVSAQTVISHMAARNDGTIILTGATAGLRAAQISRRSPRRNLPCAASPPSLAREYGPRGVHVAHVVLDGLIDGPQTDRRFGPSPSGRMDAKAIAQAYLDLAAQKPSAWTYEMDLRPFAGRF